MNVKGLNVQRQEHRGKERIEIGDLRFERKKTPTNGESLSVEIREILILVGTRCFATSVTGKCVYTPPSKNSDAIKDRPPN